MQMMSPSDMVGPSPVTSNGTETTEIEDEVSDEVRDEQPPPPPNPEPSDSQVNVRAALT